MLYCVYNHTQIRHESQEHSWHNDKYIYTFLQRIKKMRNDDLLKWKRLVESINQMAGNETEEAHTNDHPDHEVSMAKSQLLSAVKSATRIAKHLSHASEEDGLEGWVSSKLTMAEDYLQVVADYMDGEHIRESVETDEVDKVTMDVPFLIRMLEYAREDAKDDMDLHDATERMIALSKNGPLSMENYDDVVQSSDSDSLEEAKDDEQKEPEGFDPLTKQALIKIRAKYPQARDIMSAILADMEASQEVSKSNDDDHDNQIGYIQSQIDVLKKEMDRIRTQKESVMRSQSMIEMTLEESQDFHEEFGHLAYDEDGLFEAEYQGRKVQLNKPMRGDVKKFKVYVKNEKGNVVKVNFGDPDMKIKKSNPERRKSFRARHNCDNPGPKTKARYWSCRKW